MSDFNVASHNADAKPTADHSTEDNLSSSTLDATEVRQQLKRKLDLRLVIWAFLGFFALCLDRSNMRIWLILLLAANAYISGMKEDLELESAAYNWADTVMNIGYNVCQIPASLIVPRVSPQWFFPTLAIVWGTIQCCMAFVKSHQGLLALRFCLGLAQSTFQPGLIFLFGCWYTEIEVAKRISFFRAAMGISGGVGGLIGGGIVETMANRGGLHAWQWLFVVEGLISVCVGLFGYLMVPNYPHQATQWISDHERTATIKKQTSQDVVIATKPYRWKIFKHVVATPYPWLLASTVIFTVLMRHVTRVIVIILADMGYDRAFANYMSTPLNIFAALGSATIGWSADWFGDRVIHLTLLSAWGTAWNIVMAAVGHGSNPAPLVFVGAYALVLLDAAPSLAFVWALIIYKDDPNSRALAVAMVSGIGLLIPSFIGVKLWLVTDSPTFWLGKISNIGFGFASLLAVFLVWFFLRIRFRLPATTCKQGGSVSDDMDHGIKGAKADA